MNKNQRKCEGGDGTKWVCTSVLGELEVPRAGALA